MKFEYGKERQVTFLFITTSKCDTCNWQTYSILLLHVCATDMQKIIFSKSKLQVLKYRAGNPNSSSYYKCNGNGKAIFKHTPLRVQDYNRQQFEMKTTVLLH